MQASRTSHATLTPGQLRYLRKEALISIAINAGLSALFAVLVFRGGPATVEAVAVDALPQSFMIALMTTLVPTLLTRKRLRAGVVQPLAGRGPRLPANLALRALLVAAGAALIGGALHWLLLPRLGAAVWPFDAVLAFKVGYGALLARLLAPLILRRALADTAATPDLGAVRP